MMHGQHNEAARLQCFLDWLQAGGATIPSVEIRTVNGLRGAYATKRIVKGELVLHIPRNLIVTTEIAENSTIGCRITALGKFVTFVGYLTAFLLQNQREKGFWLPYVEAMPSKAPNILECGHHAPRDLLHGSNWQSQETTDLPPCEALRTTILEEYRIIHPLFETLSLREYLTMSYLVVSRMFKIDIDGRTTIALIPFIDMLNHAAPEQARWYPFASRGLTSTALRDIANGEQVHDSYGKKSNGELFTSHGFCIENNRYNWLKMRLPDIKPMHPFFEKTKAWGERRGRMRLFTISLDHKALNARIMLSYLRMACLEDLPALRCALANIVHDDILPEVSRQNEQAALEALSVACKRSLSRFDRSMEEDELLLANPALNWSERCAIMVGQGEKRILTHYRGLVDARK